MNIVSILDIMQGKIAYNSLVTIKGWIKTRRDSKLGISFLSIYDGSCCSVLQAVAENTLYNYKEEVLHITTGCSVIITGYLVKSIGKKQIIEIKINEIQVVGWIEKPNSYPISSKKHSEEFLRDMAHLRPRTATVASLTRIRHTVYEAINTFFSNQGFFWIPTPLITFTNTEGSGKMFEVHTYDAEKQLLSNKINIKNNFEIKYFFGKKAYLTVSGQLHGESYACALSKVYTFGPTFRAENSNTSRHLSEFWMVEPEVAFADLDDITKLAESMLKYIFKIILEKRLEEITFFANKFNKNIISRLEHAINNNFITIDYTDALNILKKFTYTSIQWGNDLSSEHERYLVDKHFKSPLIIRNYPKDIKAFYMRLNDDAQTVAAIDILVPDIGEILGGSQREERLEYLDKRLEELSINSKNYWWYRDLRRYGTVPHAGFGLGFERLIAYITGINNIKDIIPFPRTPNNANF